MNIEKMRLVFMSTIQREYRNKALIFLFALTVAVIVMASAGLAFLEDEVLSNYSVQGLGKTGVTVFFMVISSWSWFLGIFFGVSTFRADQRDGVLPLVLAQPLTRFEYLFSRILGTWFIVSSYYLMSLLLMAVCLSITTKAWLLGPEAIYALGLTSVSLFAVVIVSTFLSLFFDRMPALVSMSFVCLIVFAANSAFAETPMSELFNNMSFWRGLGVSVHMLLPRFSVMSSMANAILTENVTVYNSWIEAAHFVLTTGGIFALTAWIFQRRDIA